MIQYHAEAGLHHLFLCACPLCLNHCLLRALDLRHHNRGATEHLVARYRRAHLFVCAHPSLLAGDVNGRLGVDLFAVLGHRLGFALGGSSRSDVARHLGEVLHVELLRILSLFLGERVVELSGAFRRSFALENSTRAHHQKPGLFPGDSVVVANHFVIVRQHCCLCRVCEIYRHGAAAARCVRDDAPHRTFSPVQRHDVADDRRCRERGQRLSLALGLSQCRDHLPGGRRRDRLACGFPSLEFLRSRAHRSFLRLRNRLFLLSGRDSIGASDAFSKLRLAEAHALPWRLIPIWFPFSNTAVVCGVQLGELVAERGKIGRERVQLSRVVFNLLVGFTFGLVLLVDASERAVLLLDLVGILFQLTKELRVGFF